MDYSFLEPVLEDDMELSLHAQTLEHTASEQDEFNTDIESCRKGQITDRMQELLKEIPEEYLSNFYYKPEESTTELEKSLDRRRRVLRYLNKKRQKKDAARSCYLLRKQIAKSRVRFKGRFVKRTEAREIIKGCKTVSQKTD